MRNTPCGPLGLCVICPFGQDVAWMLAVPGDAAWRMDLKDLCIELLALWPMSEWRLGTVGMWPPSMLHGLLRCWGLGLAHPEGLGPGPMGICLFLGPQNA